MFSTGQFEDFMDELKAVRPTVFSATPNFLEWDYISNIRGDFSFIFFVN